MSRFTNRCSLVLVALSVGFAANCRADVVTLQDGSEHEGEVIRQTDENIVLKVRVGGMKGSITIPRCDIFKIVIRPVAEDSIALQGEKLEREAGAIKEPAKAAEAWLRVAEFYSKSLGYTAQTRAALERVLIFDPNNAQARTQLGYVKQGNEWVLPPKPKAAEAPPVAGEKPVAKTDDELIIGLRRDESLIRKLRDNQEARRRAEEEPRIIREAEPQQVYGGYARDYFYVGPYGSTYYYTPYGSYGYGGFNPGYCSYGGYGNYGYGLNVGFSGKIGKVYVRGGIFSGSGYYSGNSSHFGGSEFYGGGVSGRSFGGYSSGLMRYGF